MDRRGRDDVAAFPLEVEPHFPAELSLKLEALGETEEEVAASVAPARALLPRPRKLGMCLLETGEFLVPLLARVDVENEESSGHGAACDPNVRRRASRERRAKRLGVCRSALDPVLSLALVRTLLRWLQREASEAEFGEPQRCE
jgi:hypothetical protein